MHFIPCSLSILTDTAVVSDSIMTDLRPDQVEQSKAAWEKQIKTFNRLIADEKKKGGNANQQLISEWETGAANLRKSLDALGNGETNLTRLQS